MVKKIVIKEGKIFINVEGELKETKNPSFIGYAFLDVLENDSNFEFTL